MIQLFLVSDLYIICDKLFYLNEKLIRTIWLVTLKIFHKSQNYDDPKKNGKALLCSIHENSVD